jgi:hypothetical protein
MPETSYGIDLQVGCARFAVEDAQRHELLLYNFALYLESIKYLWYIDLKIVNIMEHGYLVLTVG